MTLIARLALVLLALTTLCLARPLGLEQYSLVRVIDGDTLVVTRPGAEPEIHVRLLGIDCLESRRIKRLDKQASGLGISKEDALSLGKETTEVVKKLVTDQPIYLELEGIKDKYGRLIAYVWTDDEQSLNLQLLNGGYAMVYDGGKTFKRQEEFQAAESAARSQRLGIWAPPRQPPVATEPSDTPSRPPSDGIPMPLLLIFVLFLAVLFFLFRRR